MKQTAVEWLSDNLWFLEEQIANKEITLGQYAVTRVELLEQAKAMHKEEILIAYDNGWEAGSYNPEQYYNEEYGK